MSFATIRVADRRKKGWTQKLGGVLGRLEVDLAAVVGIPAPSADAARTALEEIAQASGMRFTPADRDLTSPPRNGRTAALVWRPTNVQVRPGRIVAEAHHPLGGGLVVARFLVDGRELTAAAFDAAPEEDFPGRLQTEATYACFTLGEGPAVVGGRWTIPPRVAGRPDAVEDAFRDFRVVRSQTLPDAAGSDRPGTQAAIRLRGLEVLQGYARPHTARVCAPPVVVEAQFEDAGGGR